MLYAFSSAHDSISSTLPNDIAANESEHEKGEKKLKGCATNFFFLCLFLFYHLSHQMLIAQADSEWQAGKQAGSCRIKIEISFGLFMSEPKSV